LITRSGLTAEIVSAILLQLELEGKIAGSPEVYTNVSAEDS